jgi:hypothetical protein
MGKAIVAAKDCLQIRCSDEDTLQRDFEGRAYVDLDHLILGYRWLGLREEANSRAGRSCGEAR